MRNYIIRRLLLLIPTIFLVTIMVFLSVRFLPGDIVDQMLAEMMRGAWGDIDRDYIEQALGLNVPIHIQYGRWITNIFLHGSLGESLLDQSSVLNDILHRLPVSLELGILGTVIALIIAVPIGIYSAVRQDTLGDYIGRSFAIVAIAVPGFWLGTIVMIYPSIWWGWSPPIQFIKFTQDPIGNLGMFIIPSIILGMSLSGITMRMIRTMMLEVLRQDYVRTAWAKGLKERTVITRHAVKNALIPVVTMIGLSMPIMIGGTVIIEQIFCLPGMGRLMLDSINARDYTMVSGINLVVACFILANNIFIDITYAFLDPRIRFK